MLMHSTQKFIFTTKCAPLQDNRCRLSPIEVHRTYLHQKSAPKDQNCSEEHNASKAQYPTLFPFPLMVGQVTLHRITSQCYGHSAPPPQQNP